jgi:type I restriction enzyme S subunit
MTEGPYKLPEGWRWVRLGEVAYKPQYGYTASAISEPVGPKFIRITDITSGNIVWDDVPYCKCNSKVLEKYRVYPGDILFARTGSVGATVLIKEVPYEAVFASYLIRVRLRKEVLPEYVDWVLKSPVCQNQLVPQGAAQKNINAQLITQILIPLPPLAEQQCIVARIEELMGRVREAWRLRQEAQKDAERLWQSVLAQTFPRPGSDLPEGWRWVRLGEVCEVLMGQSPPSSTYNHDGLGLPFFQGKADFGELYPTPRVWCTKPMKIAEAGDILISVRAPVGPTNLARERCCIGRGLAALRAGHEIQTEWLLFYLRSIEQELGQSGSGSTFNALTKKELSAIVIPLPPLAEQRRIVAHLEAVQERLKALKEAQAATEAELKRLEQAILEKAFRGEL